MFAFGAISDARRLMVHFQRSDDQTPPFDLDPRKSPVPPGRVVVWRCPRGDVAVSIAGTPENDARCSRSSGEFRRYAILAEGTYTFVVMGASDVSLSGETRLSATDGVSMVGARTGDDAFLATAQDFAAVASATVARDAGPCSCSIQAIAGGTYSREVVHKLYGAFLANGTLPPWMAIDGPQRYPQQPTFYTQFADMPSGRYTFRLDRADVSLGSFIWLIGVDAG